jgi:hypothetical protein
MYAGGRTSIGAIDGSSPEIGEGWEVGTNAARLEVIGQRLAVKLLLLTAYCLLLTLLSRSLAQSIHKPRIEFTRLSKDNDLIGPHVLCLA